MNIKQAFVLAGGRGERLKPLTDSIPKPLVLVNGKPILEYTVEWLVENGITKIVLGIWYRHEQIESYFGNGKKWDAKILYSIESEPLGTGGALKFAEPLLDKRFFMVNGDDINRFDLKPMSELHEKKSAWATIAIRQVEDISSSGAVQLDGDCISSFVEKTGEKKPGWVNAGTYLLEKKALNELPQGFNLIEKTLFPRLAEQGRLFGFVHSGIWLRTDTFERLRLAEENLNKKDFQHKRV
ncbi:nucleotidyltransferase family protein [Candidatus Micrarchaeota archaeon]|nr:nucleotidyltransferase family protein [Candidatus Micrarchaeota archaeon]MBU1930073.1 nucleotidyltransferase family protein [Candidatus Micrarchaeota archaeon]